MSGGLLRRGLAAGAAVAAIAVVALAVYEAPEFERARRTIAEIRSPDRTVALAALERVPELDRRMLRLQSRSFCAALAALRESARPRPGAPVDEGVDGRVLGLLERLAREELPVVLPGRQIADLDPLVFHALLLAGHARLACPEPRATTVLFVPTLGRENVGRSRFAWRRRGDLGDVGISVTESEGVLRLMPTVPARVPAGVADLGDTPLEASDAPAAGDPRWAWGEGDAARPVPLVRGRTYVVRTGDRELALAIALEVESYAPGDRAALRWLLLASAPSPRRGR